MACITDTVTDLLERNKAFAAKHEPIPTFAELAEMKVPFPHIIVLTCVDPRCQPEKFFNTQTSDGVFIMRNICGHAKPALNDIVALDAFVTITDILVVHHTDCGSTHFKDAVIRATLKERLPEHKEIDEMKFGAIDDVEQSVKDDIAILRSSPLIRKELADHCFGFVYDLKAGSLSPVQV